MTVTSEADAPRVTVRGEARLEADPEIAAMSITVHARGTDRRAALTDLTRRNDDVLGLLRSYGEAVERVETGALTITPELTRHGRGERVRAHHGRVVVQTVVTDFTVLGELTTRLADLDLTRVDGPRWSLRPASPVHAEARRQAVRDAVTRARGYAEALGSTLVTLVELVDQGAEGAVPRAGYGMAAGRPVSYTHPTPPPLPVV
ncbi:SIMPL domain-containing protein [Streptomyces specialis]|uniref:SIMPL domain-containing protein n=1 Tax=Streptomyces specialis TaxID=498367 RepID=UPI00073EBFE1|nr:SIMPL domain-containing protein [Streptomyces specialis]